MTKYECDRCGKTQTELSHKIEIPNENDNWPWGRKFDLCDSCFRSLHEFFKPLPKVQQ